MKRVCNVFVLILLLILSCNNNNSNNTKMTSESIKSKAVEAYQQIEGNVFNHQEIKHALKKLEHGYNNHPNEPVIYAAKSLAILVFGFKKNDWYEVDNFQKSAVEKALESAKYAYNLKNGKKCVLTTCHMARMFILTKEFEKAQKLLENAKRLDPESFYPWYFQGILFEKTGKFARSRDNFNRAEKLAMFQYHHSILNSHRQKIAIWEKNPQELERLYLDEILRNPESAHAYGNYGSFLLQNNRIPEAIEQLEKAVEISPYGLAEHQLKDARLILNEQKSNK